MEIELDDLQFFVISFKDWVRHREVIFFIYTRQTIVYVVRLVQVSDFWDEKFTILGRLVMVYWAVNIADIWVHLVEMCSPLGDYKMSGPTDAFGCYRRLSSISSSLIVLFRYWDSGNGLIDPSVWCKLVI